MRRHRDGTPYPRSMQPQREAPGRHWYRGFFLERDGKAWRMRRPNTDAGRSMPAKATRPTLDACAEAIDRHLRAA